ncbi:hypothetical protein [uncultured Porphyromonas sp.]|nr:hypothetical protein [uncultured Porphyromonas sp.]
MHILYLEWSYTSVTASRMTDAYGAGTPAGVPPAGCALFSDESDESDGED